MISADKRWDPKYIYEQLIEKATSQSNRDQSKFEMAMKDAIYSDQDNTANQNLPLTS